MRTERLKQALFAGISLGVGVILSLVLIEVGLRIVDWPSPGLYRGRTGPLPLLLPDENGSSWRAFPGPARIRHWDYDVDVHLNEHGFVERENAPKRPGEWRVGLFGDSFTAGLGVAPEERFGNLWWRALQANDDDLSVYNFGSVWTGAAHSAAFLAAHGDEYQLDEVVLALFGGNELIDNVRWEQNRSLTEAQRAEMGRQMQSGGWRNSLRNASRAAGFLYVRLSRGLAKREVRVPTADDLPGSWPATERSLQAFLAAAGTRPVSIWYLPATTEWDDKVWSAAQSRLGLEPRDRHAVRDAVRDWAEAAGVPFLDLTDAFAGQDAAALCYKHDGHWNAVGHAIVARALIAEAPRPGPRVR